MLFTALTCLVALVSMPLLFYTALSSTSERVLERSPSLVIRQIDAGGFVPIRAQEALDAVRSVRGVVRARARLWGVVASTDGAVTTLAVDEASCGALAEHGVPCPEAGQAVVGSALEKVGGDSLQLLGPGGERRFTVRHVLSEEHDAVACDLVLLDRQDARDLLGIAPDLASDIAVWVFHEAEEEAIRDDLEHALPWPARITGRGEATEAVLASLGRRSGLEVTALIPAVFALALLMIAVARQGRSGRLEVALLKTMGWTTGDVVRLKLVQVLALSCPAVVSGLAVAFAFVIWPSAPWMLGPVLQWSGPGPRLDLDVGSASVVVAVVAGAVLGPLVAAALWPAVTMAASDPAELLEET